MTRKEIKKLDKLWSEIVKKRDGYICKLCGRKEHLNSHHIIGRVNRAVRWDLSNGITLCAKCHELGRVSAHQDPQYFMSWFEKKDRITYAYLQATKNRIVKYQDYEDIKGKLKHEERVLDSNTNIV